MLYGTETAPRKLASKLAERWRMLTPEEKEVTITLYDII